MSRKCWLLWPSTTSRPNDATAGELKEQPGGRFLLVEKGWVPGQPVASPATAGRDPTDGVGRKAVAEQRSRCARLANPSGSRSVAKTASTAPTTHAIHNLVAHRVGQPHEMRNEYKLCSTLCRDQSLRPYSFPWFPRPGEASALANSPRPGVSVLPACADERAALCSAQPRQCAARTAISGV